MLADGGHLGPMRSAYYDQLDLIVDELVAMTHQVQQSVGRATHALLTADSDIAAQVVAGDVRIDALKTEIEDLEGQNAGYQEQVLKAYRKIKADEASIDRAKKALAIALTLLDETASPATDAAGNEQNGEAG